MWKVRNRSPERRSQGAAIRMPPGITTSPFTGDFCRISFRDAGAGQVFRQAGDRGDPHPLGEVAFPQVDVDEEHLLPAGGGEVRRQVHRRNGLPFPRDGAGDRDDLVLQHVDPVLEPGAQGLELLDEHRVGTEVPGLPVGRFPQKGLPCGRGTGCSCGSRVQKLRMARIFAWYAIRKTESATVNVTSPPITAARRRACSRGYSRPWTTGMVPRIGAL